MIIKEIQADNFRNLSKVSLEFSKTFNLIEGMNSQGKTNLLEAIHIFSLGRSFRTRRMEELVRFGEDYFFLKLTGKSDSTVDFSIEFGFKRGEKARVSANGNRLSSPAEMIGIIPTVIFTAEDVEITSGPPAGRRQYLDYTAAQISPAFLSDLKEYRRVVRHRNSLLKGFAADGKDPRELDAWDDSFIKKGVEVIRGRKEVLNEIARIAGKIYSSIRPGEEALTFKYSCSFGDEEESLDEALRKALSRSSETERKKGYTTVGPHYDDITVSLGERRLRKYGSQGIKRLVAIILKLTQATVIMEKRAERPVVLLDDIFSELDPGISARVRDLLSDSYQSFITSPGSGDFARLPGGAAVLSVENGIFSRKR